MHFTRSFSISPLSATTGVLTALSAVRRGSKVYVVVDPGGFLLGVRACVCVFVCVLRTTVGFHARTHTVVWWQYFDDCGGSN